MPLRTVASSGAAGSVVADRSGGSTAESIEFITRVPIGTSGWLSGVCFFTYSSASGDRSRGTLYVGPRLR